MTNSHGSRAIAVVISSTMPSAKYSCSGSPLKFWNGSTAIDGLSGNANGTDADAAGFAPRRMRQTCTGLAMFLTCCSPHILRGEVELVAHLVVHDAAHTDTARLGERFQTRRYIDAVAIDVVVVEDDVAEIDPDAELDALILRHPSVALGHRLLHLDRAAHRVDDTGELDQQPVAGGLDDPAPMLLDLRITQLAADRLQRGERALLVRPHQPRIARDIGGQDRGETAGLAHT